MVESTAETQVMYRGFIMTVRAKKDSNGSKSAYIHIRHHIPELKPKHAENIDRRETVETQDGEIECMKIYDTIGPIEADRLAASEFYDPRFDEPELGTLDSILSMLGIDRTEPEPSLSCLVRDAVQETQDRIDAYIQNHSLVEVNAEEVKHGLEQSISTPLSDVEVHTPEMNTETEYDSVRPEAEVLNQQLENL